MRRRVLAGLAVFLFALAVYGLFREIPPEDGVLARVVPVLIATGLGVWVSEPRATRPVHRWGM